MVSEERRWKEKPDMNRFDRAYSLTCPAAMQIYWNKRKCLHKKRVELTQDWLGAPTCPPSHCFATPIWLPYVVMCIRSIPYSDVFCTHIDNGDSETGVLGHPSARKTRRRVIKAPVPERPVVYVCIIAGHVSDLFSIEEMWHYCIMGRGRNGRQINPQSQRNIKYPRGQSCAKQRSKKIYSYLNKPLIL